MSLDDDFSAFLTEIESLPETVETKGQNSPDYSATQEHSNKKKRKLNNDCSTKDVEGGRESRNTGKAQLQVHQHQIQKKIKHTHATGMEHPPPLQPSTTAAMPMARPRGMGRGGLINQPAWMTHQQQQQHLQIGPTMPVRPTMPLGLTMPVGPTMPAPLGVRPHLLNMQPGGSPPLPVGANSMNTSFPAPRPSVQAVVGPSIPSSQPSTDSAASVKEWPKNDFRLFVGDLDIQVKSEHLDNAFKHYKSFAMSRVIVNHKTKLSKGYGFVSFLDPYDCYNAMKEMNRKVIMGRPITLKFDQSKTKFKPQNIRAKEKRRKKFLKRFS